MAWVKIDDQAPRHAKMLKAGPSACWLWVCGIAHCQSQLTDGFVSLDALPMIGVKGESRCIRLAEELATVGLFDRTDGGYMVHGYLDHNPSKASVLAKRAEDAERKRRGEESARNPKGIRPESPRSPELPAPASHPIPSHPIRTKEKIAAAPLASLAFEKFWSLYPKHTGRKAALEYWMSLAPDEAFTARILSGLAAYVAHVRDWKPEYIKAPVKWLEGAHWEDDIAACASVPARSYDWTCPHDTPHLGRRACEIATALAEAKHA